MMGLCQVSTSVLVVLLTSNAAVYAFLAISNTEFEACCKGNVVLHGTIQMAVAMCTELGAPSMTSLCPPSCTTTCVRVFFLLFTYSSNFYMYCVFVCRLFSQIIPWMWMCAGWLCSTLRMGLTATGEGSLQSKSHFLFSVRWLWPPHFHLPQSVPHCSFHVEPLCSWWGFIFYLLDAKANVNYSFWCVLVCVSAKTKACPNSPCLIHNAGSDLFISTNFLVGRHILVHFYMTVLASSHNMILTILWCYGVQ